jgi:hypothetical protein
MFRGGMIAYNPLIYRTLYCSTEGQISLRHSFFPWIQTLCRCNKIGVGLLKNATDSEDDHLIHVNAKIAFKLVHTELVYYPASGLSHSFKGNSFKSSVLLLQL